MPHPPPNVITALWEKRKGEKTPDYRKILQRITRWLLSFLSRSETETETEFAWCSGVNSLCLKIARNLCGPGEWGLAASSQSHDRKDWPLRWSEMTARTECSFSHSLRASTRSVIVDCPYRQLMENQGRTIKIGHLGKGETGNLVTSNYSAADQDDLGFSVGKRASLSTRGPARQQRIIV